MVMTYKAGERPRIRLIGEAARSNVLPNLVLTSINSKTAYFRSSHVVGGLACNASDVEIIRHPDHTPVLESEQWPPLTPYDTGERLQPGVWVTADPRRPEEFDRDRYGKVDFDKDESATIVTVWVERTADGFVLNYYSHGDDVTVVGHTD